MSTYGFHFIKDNTNKNYFFSIQEVAKKLNVGNRKLFRFLKEQGILNKDNTPKVEVLDEGFYPHSYSHNSYLGYTSSPSCRVDEKGFEFIKNLVERNRHYFK